MVASGAPVHQEISALKKLNQAAEDVPNGSGLVPQLLDEFCINGPNGTHEVLVLEPVGRSLQEHLLDLLRLDEDDLDYRRVGFMREVSRQLLSVLRYVHSKRIVHRDVQPDNVLLALQYSLDLLDEEAIQADTRINKAQNVFELRRVDGKPLDASSPKYVVEPNPLNDEVQNTWPPPEFRIVLSDFGAASAFEDSNDGGHAYPSRLRPPELLLELPLSEKADIWSLGCVIFQIVTLTNAFSVDPFDTPEEQDNRHLQSMTEVLGPLPPNMLKLWKDRDSFVDPNGNLLPEVVEEGISEPLSERIAMRRPVGMSLAEAAVFEDFIRSTLQYEPRNRASTADLLSHSWITRSFNN